MTTYRVAAGTHRRAAGDPTAPDPVRDAVMRLRRQNALLACVRRAWEVEGAVHADSVQVQQTHYKPLQRARLVARVAGRSAGPDAEAVQQYLFIQVYPSAEDAVRRFEGTDRKHALKCVGPPVFVLPELNAVAWSLPNSPRLRTAKIGFRPKRFGKFLRRQKLRRYLMKRNVDPLTLPRRPDPPELIRLVPRRRALFRYAVPGADPSTTLFIKVYSPGHGRLAMQNLRLVASVTRRGQLGFRVPRAVSYSTRRRAMVMKGLPGVPLSDPRIARDPQVLASVFRGLAALHGSGVEPTARWSPDAELDALDDAMVDMKRALPGHTGEIDRLVAGLRRRRADLHFEHVVPIHGNLFGDQVLIDGDKIGIVDWDDLALGDAEYDIARLIAHLVFLWRRASMPRVERQRIEDASLAAYTGATGHGLDAARLRWHKAVALLMRAKISALRPLPDTWISDVAGCIDEASELLA